MHATYAAEELLDGVALESQSAWDACWGMAQCYAFALLLLYTQMLSLSFLDQYEKLTVSVLRTSFKWLSICLLNLGMATLVPALACTQAPQPTL